MKQCTNGGNCNNQCFNGSELHISKKNNGSLSDEMQAYISFNEEFACKYVFAAGASPMLPTLLIEAQTVS